MRKVNIAQALATFSEAWSPRIAGEVNGFQVKLVKLRGAFDWHRHEIEDELFLVVEGRLRMGLRGGDIDTFRATARPLLPENYNPGAEVPVQFTR